MWVIQGMEEALKISSSNVGMEAARSYHSVTAESIVVTRIAAGEGNLTEEKTSETRKKDTKLKQYFSDMTENTENTEKELEYSFLGLRSNLKTADRIQSSSSGAQNNVTMTIRVRTLMFLIQLLANDKNGSLHKLRETVGSDYSSGKNTSEDLFRELQGYATGTTSANTVTSTYQSTVFSENENTSFRTRGSVVTADGRQLSFGIELEMSRSFTEKYDMSSVEQSISYCDPLVINLNANIAEVSDQKFFFDIDSDGTKDSISQLSKNSGYLALDINQDGIINDGSELFGTKSGNGFKDLAKYDSDGDGWIDEDDEIWSKLLIWSKDEKGNDTLYHLTDKGVGAICLQNISTDFSLNSAETNQVNAKIRNTGIFLYENGTVGTVQHLDLAK